MIRRLVYVGLTVFLYAAQAQADKTPRPMPEHGRRHAPEPLTLMGLAAGGSSVAYAAWRKRRSGK